MSKHFSEEDTECRVVDVQGLIGDIRGSTGFSYDKIMLQLAEADDLGEDLFWQHGKTRYRIPLAHIRTFFTQYKKPQRPMTPAQELKFLREKAAELEAENEKLRGVVKPEATGATMADVMKGDATPADLRKEFEDHQMSSMPAVKPHPAPRLEGLPTRDENIPRETTEDVQQRLKRELEATKPANVREKAAQGVGASEGSPKAPEGL